MKLKSPYLVKPQTKVRLSDLATDDHGDFTDKDEMDAIVAEHAGRLNELQEVLFAAQSKALLIVLEGMDTAGKDGTIRHIFSGVNPQGCEVASFKVPTQIERRHDFLWRCHAMVPPLGMIGIFNRSHYEDVLSPVVHGHMSQKEALRHMDEINNWERMLTDNHVVILKFFLHISKQEQMRRLQERIDEPKKHWKLSPSDFEERPKWAAYMKAYEAILRHTSHKYAPWFVIPADHKSYRNVTISAILVDAMERMKLKFPEPTFDPSGLKLDEMSPEQASKEIQQRVNPGVVSANEIPTGSGRR